MNKWRILYQELTIKHDYLELNPPSTLAQISDVEKTLDCILPGDIKELLLETNGDNWFVFTTEQIIEINLSMRALVVSNIL